MKRTILACLLLIVLTAIRAHADEPAAEVTEPVIPERKLAFEVSEEERPTKINFFGGANQQTFRYVAVLTLTFEFPSEGDSHFLRHIESYTQDFLQLSRKVPQKQRPSKNTLSILRNRLHVRPVSKELPDGRMATVVPVPGGASVEYNVFAFTAEEAQELVEAILLLFDYGFSQPKYQEYEKRRDFFQGMVLQRQGKLKQAQDELPGYEQQLEEVKAFRDIDAKSLADFRTQRWLISADLIGIQARIEACERILQKDSPRFSTVTREEAETAKIRAEIELVGLAARRKAIEEMAEKGQRYAELAAKAKEARGMIQHYPPLIKKEEGRLAEYERAVKEKMPFAKVGPIKIQPIRWEPAE